MTDVDLAIRLTAEASDAESAFRDVGDSASAMASEVDNAAAKADAATSKLDGVAASADSVDSKMGAATGSLGALAGGLEAAGFDGAAAGLQTLAVATDFASGAGGVLNLVLESQAVMNARAKAAAIASAVATKAQGAASKVAAVGQWALNAALAANPVGLVVVAVAALVGGLILAYNKSETFRNIVDKAMSVAKTAVQTVVDKVGDLIKPIKDAADKFPGLSTAVETAKTLIVGYFDLITTPIRTVIGLVDDLIGKLQAVKDFGGKVLGAVTGGRISARGDSGSGVKGYDLPASGGGSITLISLDVQALDTRQAARDIISALRREGVSLGNAVVAP